MIEVDGKVYRNLQEQVLENQKDIKNLQDNTYDKEEIDDALEEKANVSDVYNKTTADATFQTIAGMSAYALKDYIHQITLYNDNYASSGLHCFLTFNIRNDVSTPYTTASQVYDALIAKYGENKFTGGSGYYQIITGGGVKEILYNISTRSNTDYILDAEYFEVDDNADSGSETIDLTNFSVKDIIL